MKSKDLAKERINEEDTPQRVDEILTAKYGFSLYYYCHSMADLLYHEPTIVDSVREFAGFKLPEKYWDNLINRLEDLKEITLTQLDAIGYILEPFDDGFYMQVKYEEYDLEEYSEDYIDEIKKDFKLNPYFKAIDEKIERLKSFKEKTPTDKRGRPIKARNMIALIWSYIMKKPSGCDWKGMADLFDWFSYNLKATYYGDKLQAKPEEDSFYENHLKREVLRLKANLKKNDFLRKRIEILKDYYFSHKDLEKMSTVDFTEKISQADTNVPMVGGEQESGLIWDKNLLVIFPDDKYLARPGRPLKRKDLRPKVVSVRDPDNPSRIKAKFVKSEED
jgi:hypothetical protein